MPYQQVHDLMFPHGAISRIEPLDPKVQSSKGLPPAWVVYFQMYDAGRDIMRVSLLLPPTCTGWRLIVTIAKGCEGVWDGLPQVRCLAL